ncbi:diacylglycerol kinase [Aquibacillus halophilus]|uniref:Diacylglycerol kinase n=1 Tax=Aquibacillus halophilus TaxID=930132 RepID=A0A6A8DCW1_9BACI|nr:diacylglycerol kinase family protein [Aquibacillus halophilus]MRH43090.1 diacylglycerol kinase [Aquibacillus halophilus]
MPSDFQDNKKRQIGISFALKGIKEVIRTEINFKVHLLIALVVIILGLFFQLTSIEWILILLTIGFVLTFEMLNTAIERVLNYLAPEIHPVVGTIKDISAGAVFVAALTSIINGLIIFLPKIISLFQ